MRSLQQQSNSFLEIISPNISNSEAPAEQVLSVGQ
jgi:hypothetical protein